MFKILTLISTSFLFLFVLIEHCNAQGSSAFSASSASTADSVSWIEVKTDSGVIHAAVATPKGQGPFPAVIILHGTHGFAQEYINMARSFADQGIIGIAACWFTGRKGLGVRFVTPIEFDDAPPLVEAPGLERFRISRYSIDLLVRKVLTLPHMRNGSLAILGHSRGSGAGFDYMLHNPGKIQALIINSGGYPPEFIEKAGSLKVPILIFHGVADGSNDDGGSEITSIGKAREFEAAMKSSKQDVEVRYFEGSGHNAIFTDRLQFVETLQTSSTFLKRKLSK